MAQRIMVYDDTAEALERLAEEKDWSIPDIIEYLLDEHKDEIE